jgi:hypothetical protein
MSPISLSTSVAGIEASFSPPPARGSRSRSRPAAAPCGAPRTAPRTSDQDAGGAEHDALPFGLGQRPGEIARQHAAAPALTSRSNSVTRSDQAALGAQHLLVEIGDLRSRVEIAMIASA